MRTANTTITKLSELDLSISPFLIGAILLVSLAIIYIIGFSPSPDLHNAFHDVRHSVSFPCH